MAIHYDDSGQSLSSETRALVEGEVKRLLTCAYGRAKALLRSHEAELHELAKVWGGGWGWGSGVAAQACGVLRAGSWGGAGAAAGVRARVVACVTPNAPLPPPLPPPRPRQELLEKETLTGAQIQELLARVGKGGAGRSAAAAS